MRSDISTHDCLISLVRHVKGQNHKISVQRDRIGELECEVKRLHEAVRERDRRIIELEAGGVGESLA